MWWKKKDRQGFSNKSGLMLPTKTQLLMQVSTVMLGVSLSYKHNMLELLGSIHRRDLGPDFASGCCWGGWKEFTQVTFELSDSPHQTLWHIYVMPFYLKQLSAVPRIRTDAYGTCIYSSLVSGCERPKRPVFSHICNFLTPIIPVKFG